MLDNLIARWRQQREELLIQLDTAVSARWLDPKTQLQQIERGIKRIAKLDCRISTAEVLRRRYLPVREPSSLEHASAIAALLAEGGHV